MRGRGVWSIVAVAVFALASACSDAPKATRACGDKQHQGSRDCLRCCKENGASGYRWSGGQCGCLNGP